MAPEDNPADEVAQFGPIGGTEQEVKDLDAVAGMQGKKEALQRKLEEQAARLKEYAEDSGPPKEKKKKKPPKFRCSDEQRFDMYCCVVDGLIKKTGKVDTPQGFAEVVNKQAMPVANILCEKFEDEINGRRKRKKS